MAAGGDLDKIDRDAAQGGEPGEGVVLGENPY